MRVSLNWLREYVDFDLSPEELAEQFDMTGTGVEAIEHFGRDLQKIVVGLVRKVEKHPNADKLTVCRVDIGKKELLDIVCGAPNVREGIKVPVALVGAKLPGGFNIQKTKIRGIASEGMMCSEAELELGEDTSGLMILDEGAPVGVEIGKALGLQDAVLELEITPNRPDCLGMIGIAREVAAIVGAPLRIPQLELKEDEERADDATGVEIIDADLCPHYAAKIIKDIKILPSPAWMQRRLEKAGLRPINNIVDITNYVMLETSQPLHAFDYDRLAENRIVVRRPKRGEIIETLDEVTRQLDETMLVIADAGEPVALAGVMGGLRSEVSSKTTNILLESAHFNAASIMRTSRKLGLQSEAAARFEKCIDPNGVIFAANRAAQLMAELGGGRLLKGEVDAYPNPIRPRKIRLRTKRVNQILGTRLSGAKITGILESLELKISKDGKSTRDEAQPAAPDLQATIPTFRPDLEREIDLIEEIVRLYGYNKVKSTLPERSGKKGGLSSRQKLERSTKNFLIACGLSQVLGYGFINPEDFDKLRLPADSPLRQVITLLNPLTAEQSVMRSTLLPGLLNILKHNVNRDQTNVQIFEMGRVFEPSADKLPHESLMLSGALTGHWHRDSWYEKAEEVDFFDVKGIQDAFFEHLNVSEWYLVRALHPSLHPGKCAEIFIENEAIGIMGEIHPETQRNFELSESVGVFELNLDRLLSYVQPLRHFEEIPRFPGVAMDVAVVVAEEVAASEIEKIIKEEGGKLLRRVDLFDVYRGGQVSGGKKSLAFSLSFRSDDRTLDLDEVKKIHGRIISKLAQIGAELRT